MGWTEEADRALNGAFIDAVSRVMEQAAPDLAALLAQFRLHIEHAHGELVDDHADDTVMISRMLAGHETESGLVRLYQSALRLAGETSPVLNAQAFDAGAWIDDLYKVKGFTQEVGQQMLAALPEWKRELVREAAHRRPHRDDSTPATTARLAAE